LHWVTYRNARAHLLIVTIVMIRGRAANDGSKWVCVPVEWEIGKFERLSQKPSTHS